jgi:hypothetical protein
MQDMLKIIIIIIISSLFHSGLNAENSIHPGNQYDKDPSYFQSTDSVEINDTVSLKNLNPDHSEFEDSSLVNSFRKTAEDNEINQVPGTFRVYPNPANDFINIFFTSEEAKPVSVEVRNVHGQILLTRNNIYPGYPLRIVSRDFNPGVYIISLKTSMGDIHRRIIKE